MDIQNITPHKAVSLFVKDVIVFNETNSVDTTVLPFFADGYPGLIFQETANGMSVNPHKKKMPVFFLYGQTIRPIELVMKGNFQLVVFQLYPFVLKSFFGVDPLQINDNCYDLVAVNDIAINRSIAQLQQHATSAERVAEITTLLYSIFQSKKETLDFTVREAIQLILDGKGQANIGALPGALHITGRTLERRFLKETGISPKQFSKIIQFQLSLEQLSIKDYSKLTDIVYNNGFADQSHFIKVFKAFTGRTPKKFQQHTTGK